MKRILEILLRRGLIALALLLILTTAASAEILTLPDRAGPLGYDGSHANGAALTVSDDGPQYDAVAGEFSFDGTAADDIFTITGSNTKVVRVWGMSLEIKAGTSAVCLVRIVKRSTADSGGTATTLTAVPRDRLLSPATATLKAYTANPSVGTAVGAVFTTYYEMPAVGTTGSAQPRCDVRFSPPIILRGSSDVLSWDFLNAAAPAASKTVAAVSWSESAT